MTLLKRIFRKKNELTDVLNRILGFRPKQISIYQQAFLHKSIIKNLDLKPYESNERLEFLGDAILDSIIANYLFLKFPLKDEGYLTQLRSRIVSRQNLNQLGEKIGLKELITAKLDQEIKSIYGNALEALIGAIFIDKGFETTKKFVENKLLAHYLDIEHIINTETDFKSRVIEWCQKNKIDFDFRNTETKKKHYKIYTSQLIIGGELKGKGLAQSKKKAEQIAAAEFYQIIR